MKEQRNAKGEGSFKINQDGSVTHRKSVGFKVDGKRKVLTVTAPTKSACIRAMKKMEDEWNRQKSSLHIQSKDTVTDLCFRHLDYQVENEELKPKAIDRRECTIRNQIEKCILGQLQIHSVTSNDIERHIQALINEKRLSESSIVKALDVLNAAYEWAIQQGDIEFNPVSAVKKKLSKKLKKLSEKKADEADVAVFSEEESERFIREATRLNSDGTPVYPAGDYLLLLLFTALRCGEMIGLRWSAYERESGILTVECSASMAKNRNKRNAEDNNYIMMEGTTKNQKARIIQLSPEAIQVMERIYERQGFPEPDDLVAPTQSGKMNTASNLEHRMKVILHNAGLDNVAGGLHTFRKTAATRMYEAGARVEEIAAYIGDLESTTRKYYIAMRKKMMTKEGVKQIVRLPESMNTTKENGDTDNEVSA